jgi:hypothetical protein
VLLPAHLQQNVFSSSFCDGPRPRSLPCLEWSMHRWERSDPQCYHSMAQPPSPPFVRQSRTVFARRQLTHQRIVHECSPSYGQVLSRVGNQTQYPDLLASATPIVSAVLFPISLPTSTSNLLLSPVSKGKWGTASCEHGSIFVLRPLRHRYHPELCSSLAHPSMHLAPF